MIAAGARIPAIAAAQRAVYSSLAEAGGVPTAAYSVRQVNKSYPGPCVKVRRSVDNTEQDIYFAGEDLDTTSLLRFVKNEDAPLPVDRGDAVGAYSLRKVSSSYTGSAVKVRRSVDNAESDIGFTASGDLDEVALLAFVGNTGSDNGFVTTWYDQSGGGNHATQGTAGSQPKIVSGGVVVTKNGKPALDFDGVNDSLATTGYIVELSANNATVLAVVDTTNSKYILAEGDVVSPYSSNFIFGSANSDSVLWVNTTVFGTTITGHKLVGFTYDGTNFQAYQNGATDGASGTATVNSEVLNKTVIGASADQSTAFYTGKIQELITYNTNKSSSRASIEDEINQYYSIYTEAVKDGFVTTWYDQSGNGYHATQSTAGSQPKIVSAGALVTENGKVALDFDSDFLTVPSSTATFKYLHDGTESAVVLVATAGKVANPDAVYGYFGNNSRASANTGTTVFYDDRAPSSNNRYFGFVTRGSAGNPSAEVIFDDKITANEQRLISTFIDANNATASDRLKAGINGDILFGNNTDTFGPVTTDASYDMQVGASGNDNAPLVGYMQEVLFFNTDKSSLRTAIEGNINAYFNIF